MSAAADNRRPLGTEQTTVFEVTALELQGGDAIAVLTLTPTAGADAPAWTPGSHVDVLLENGLQRQYSLCGEADSGQPWQLGILRDPASRGGSEFIHTQIRVGQHLTLRGPRNNFELVDAPAYQFIAGGIGITPLLAMIRQVDAEDKPWRLMYGGRSLTSLAFLDEVASYGDHVTLWPQDTDGIIPVKEIVERLEPGTVVYCCGPEPLLIAVEDALADLPVGVLHTERFKPRQDLVQRDSTSFDIVLDYSDIELHVPSDRSIVEVVEAAGIDVLTSCREGTCGTCETAVLEGIPDHRDSYLNAAEKASNEVMMLCCSRSKTPRLVLDL